MSQQPEFESFEGSEIERKFRCPYCHERISMLLDISEPGRQLYVEDCEVCCKPIQVSYTAQGGRLIEFVATRNV